MTNLFSFLSLQARSTAVALAALALALASLAASLWLASFFLYTSLHINPLHAGLWGWLDLASAWCDGVAPNVGRRLVGAALFGALLAVAGPVLGIHAIRGCSGRRRLYGSARFASGAEIRDAGLL